MRLSRPTLLVFTISPGAILAESAPEISRNITTKCYAGGHMMYETKGVREQLRRDIEKFIADTVGSRRARASL